jgi:hypothetical protein
MPVSKRTVGCKESRCDDDKYLRNNRGPFLSRLLDGEVSTTVQGH